MQFTYTPYNIFTLIFLSKYLQYSLDVLLDGNVKKIEKLYAAYPVESDPSKPP